MKVRRIWYPRTEGSFFCYSDGGINLGGGDNITVVDPVGGDGTVHGGEPVPAHAVPPVIDWEQWSRPIERLGETLSGKLDALQGTVREATTPPAAPTAPVDFETMTQSELAVHLLGNVNNIVQEAIKAALTPVMQQVQHAQTTATTVDLNRTIDQLKSQHKDFSDWKDEMIGLAKQHPTLGMEHLYQLARASNAAKATELHTKYNPPPARPAPRFGGLVPGSVSGSPGTPKPLTPQQASFEAYQETQAKYPDLLPALQRL
jgi:hypothetical protein